MKIGKAQPFAVFRNGEAYEIYSSLEDGQREGVEALVELCAESFEMFTGIQMEDGAWAIVTLRVSKAMLEETKLVRVK